MGEGVCVMGEGGVMGEGVCVMGEGVMGQCVYGRGDGV